MDRWSQAEINQSEAIMHANTQGKSLIPHTPCWQKSNLCMLLSEALLMTGLQVCDLLDLENTHPPLLTDAKLQQKSLKASWWGES